MFAKYLQGLLIVFFLEISSFFFQETYLTVQSKRALPSQVNVMKSSDKKKNWFQNNGQPIMARPRSFTILCNEIAVFLLKWQKSMVLRILQKGRRCNGKLIECCYQHVRNKWTTMGRKKHEIHMQDFFYRYVLFTPQRNKNLYNQNTSVICTLKLDLVSWPQRKDNKYTSCTVKFNQ